MDRGAWRAAARREQKESDTAERLNHNDNNRTMPRYTVQTKHVLFFFKEKGKENK